jgi:hypothetical protein
LVVWLLVACNLQTTPNEASVQATLAALSTENARLTTAVATVAATHVVTGSATSSAPTAASNAGLLPRLVADVVLAPGGQTLRDLRLDPAAGRLYVTDSSGQLWVLDATTYTVLKSLPLTGDLTLDSDGGRLYVAAGGSAYHETPTIAVIDTQTMEVVGTIADASHVAVDSGHGRLFVGKAVSALAQGQSSPGVRVLDARSLAQVGEIPQGGIPVYNPLRNELLIVAGSVYTADPDAARVTGDLLPEVSDQPCPECVGSLRTAGVWLFADENVLALDVLLTSTPGGPGLIQPPRWLDATTLALLTDGTALPVIQPGCGSQRQLLPAIDGRIYRALRYARYVLYNNLYVYDEMGALLTWRDGLAEPFINTATRQLYSGDWVLDLATLTPLASLPMPCILAQDRIRGLLYGLPAHQPNHLWVMQPIGAALPSLAPTLLPALPGDLPITQIHPSPNYANDQTLFMLSNTALYRSRDGGQQWARLSTPTSTSANYAAVSLAFSPDFANDATLFLGATLDTAHGAGVWRSTDGGDSWQALWQGMHHLRVYQVAVSPSFAKDGTVAAYATYNRLQPFEAGVSIHRATDRGLSWSLVMTASEASQLPPPSQLLSIPAPPVLPWRLPAFGNELNYTTDGGASWRMLALPMQGEYADLVQIAPAPTYPQENTVYVLGDYGFWRIRDLGEGPLIDNWVDERVTQRVFTNTFSALALSPPLSDGSYVLMVGTRGGELWVLNPTNLTWAPTLGLSFVEATPTATLLPTLPPTETPPLTPAVTATPAPAVKVAITPTVLLTATIVATATPGAPLADEPPAGLFRPGGAFAVQWENSLALQSQLGWATTPLPSSPNAAVQSFERGIMLWRGDTAEIVVLSNDNRWQAYTDRFVEGQAERDPTIVAPAGKLQPIRGFGKLWREQAGVRDQLGWAIGKEGGVTALVQSFEHGFLIRLGGLVYALVEQGDGQRVWLVV